MKPSGYNRTHVPYTLYCKAVRLSVKNDIVVNGTIELVLDEMGSYLCMSCSTRISSFKLSCHYGYYRFMRYNTHHNSTKIPMYSALHQMTNPRCNSPHQFSRTLSSVCSKSVEITITELLDLHITDRMTTKQTRSQGLSEITDPPSLGS